MGLSVLLLLIVSWQLDFSQGQGQDCGFDSLPAELWVKEGSPNGTVLLKQAGLEKMVLTRYNSPQPPPFVGLQGGTLYLNDTFQLDGQRALCDDFFNQALQWKLFFCCQGQPETCGQHPINLYVNLTDDFPPEFTTNFMAQLQEMKVVGSEVMTVRSDQITDRDCASDAQVGSSIFRIEAGNRNEAFAFPNPRSGRIVVRRLLDYESGDTHFLLNLSISDMNLPDRKSYTTLEVTVIDIDDSDPVFDQQGYVLHVQEEDTASVGVWTNTDPPISVSDPDKDVADHDPLTISLYNVSDASSVEVNSSTGQVKLTGTVDREQHPSLYIVLKVQQTINWRRSSTVTLTVLVDDVNDHPPLFTQSVYDVSVAEHSPPGTSIALVLATDADVGINANFTYSLLGGDSVFSLVDRRLGRDVYGLLLVRNSSLLDRESTPHINLTIGTEEGAEVLSGGCQSGACQAQVLITLWDINDHSPVFDQPLYVLRISNTTTNRSPVLASVKATDADIGPNADVTYAMREFGPNVCDYVTIDARSGDVSLTDSVTRTEECSMIVIACDNPVELSQRRCSTVPVQILSGDKEEVNMEVVVIEAPIPPACLLSDTAYLERELGVVLGVSVSVRYIRADSEPSRSSVAISAINIASGKALSSEELQILVDDKQEEIGAIFQRYHVVDGDRKENDDDVFSPIFIALIVIVVALLVAVLIALVFVVRNRRRFKKQKRLLEKFASTIRPISDSSDTPTSQNGTALTPTTITTTTTNTNNNNNGHSSMTSAARDVINTASDVGTASLRSSDGWGRDGNAGYAETAILAELGRADVLRKATVPGIAPPTSDRRVKESDTLSSQDTNEVVPIAIIHGTNTTNTASNNHHNNNANEAVTVDNASRPSSIAAIRDGLNAAPDRDPHISGVFQPNAEEISESVAYADNGDPHSQQSDDRADHSASEDEAGLTASSQLADLQEPAWLLTPPLSASEEDQDRAGLSEEPEPDYAKKVHFSASVVQPESSGGENGGDGKESDLANGHGAEMDWNMYDEMTAF